MIHNICLIYYCDFFDASPLKAYCYVRVLSLYCVRVKMVERCGRQGGGGGGRRREAGLQSEAGPVAIPSPSVLTAERLEALVDTLGAIRHLTLHLADTVCKTHLTPGHHGDQHTSCWNGTSLAP